MIVYEKSISTPTTLDGTMIIDFGFEMSNLNEITNGEYKWCWNGELLRSCLIELNVENNTKIIINKSDNLIDLYIHLSRMKYYLTYSIENFEFWEIVYNSNSKIIHATKIEGE